MTHRRDYVILCLILAATPVLSPAQDEQSAGKSAKFTTLFNFDGTDGESPLGGLVQATDGNFYGTTSNGGGSAACSGGCGTIFKITPTGAVTITLHSFDSTDGAYPVPALVQAADGNLYGTTYYGGANGDGTVFKITLSGTLTTLYSFDGTDGDSPAAALVQATDGNLYGTTWYGGANGDGTVFKITLSGTLTTLHSFCSQISCDDGNIPIGLVEATDGNFYGTASYGGGGPVGGGGTVFKITPSGTLTTLYTFCSQSGCTDGDVPVAALVQATDGNFYGTTFEGGADGDGTVFKITPSGTLTTLHSFDGTDGDSPDAALVKATDRNLYGTTIRGGANGDGTVFKITLSGTLTTLHSFDSTDGDSPDAAPIQDTNGGFYGTTSRGGANSGGTVFSLAVGVGPFVKAQTTSGKVGALVKILGTNLTGATNVTFNGIPASFTVRSGALITATVPAGATSGEVEVVTPGRTLSSNVPFRVR